MAFQTECQLSLPEGKQITTEKETDIVPKLPTEMTTEKSSENAPKVSSTWQLPGSSPLRPHKMPNHEMARSTNAM